MLAKTNTILAQLGLGKPDAKYSIFLTCKFTIIPYLQLYTKCKILPSILMLHSRLSLPKALHNIFFIYPLCDISQNFSVTHKNLHPTHQKAKQIWRQLCHILKLPFLLADNAKSVIPCTLSSLSIPSLLHNFCTEVLPAHNKAHLKSRPDGSLSHKQCHVRWPCPVKHSWPSVSWLLADRTRKLVKFPPH